ncbi:MAG: hypothetical protein RQ752_09450 [Thermohalobaculum sp.]|nr:hypothetical protein [Thermohalobaculum sp.]
MRDDTMTEQALRQMPHAGTMRLLAEVLSADPDRIRCRATDHRAAGYPLRIAGVLHAAALVEIGAQAAAAHASLHAIGAAHTGLVLTLGNVVLARGTVGDDGPLTARAERIAAHDAAASYRFEVADDAGCIVSGELLLSMQRSGT